MLRGATLGAAVGAVIAVVATVTSGCRNCSPEVAIAPGQSPLETAIARAVGRRVSASVTVSCAMTPPKCVAVLPDGSRLPIALASSGGEWTWRVDGLLVRADAVETQIHTALGDLGADRAVACGVRVRRVAVDEAIECTLAGGGRAFATVHADGSVALELELDPGAAAARAEAATVDHERALTAASAALATAGDVVDDDEEGTTSDGAHDGGVPDGSAPR